MAAVRAASITRLCAADHGDDPAAIADWTANKSAAFFLRLLGEPDVRLLVAQWDAEVVGVGGLRHDTVTLNYVHPDHRFRGISKALMARIESEMRSFGLSTARLYSTATALRFYRAIGWSTTGDGDPDEGYPMTKAL